MTEPASQEAASRSLVGQEERVGAAMRQPDASSDEEGADDAAGARAGQEQPSGEQIPRQETEAEAEAEEDGAWHGRAAGTTQTRSQTQSSEQERRQTTATTAAEDRQPTEELQTRSGLVGHGSELDTSTDTTRSLSTSRPADPGVTTSGVVTPVRLVESTMEAPSPIPYVPDDTVVGDPSAKGSVAISYGNVVHRFQAGKELTAQHVLDAFGLPAITEFQIRDDAGDEVELGSARLHRNLSLVVRRSRRRPRTADPRMQRSVLRRDLDAGMALLEEKQAMLTDGNGDGTAPVTWEQFRYALRADVEDGFRKSISLSRLSQASTQSRRRASTISVSNPTHDTQQRSARPSQQAERSSCTFEADYVQPKTLVIMYSAQGFGFSCRRLCVVDESSPSSASSSQDSGRGPCMRLTLMEMDESLLLPEEATTSKTFISTVLSGSTAELAGLQPGDLIHKINDRPVDGMTLDEVHSLLASCQSDLVLWASCILKGRVDEEDEEGNQMLQSASLSRVASFFGDPVHPEASFLYEVTRAGTVQVKIVREGGGKKMRKRPWKEYMAALRGHVLYLYSSKDRMDGPLGHRPAGGRFNVKSALADIAYDYKKRKHVFRLQTFNGAVCLIQANSHDDMLAWIRAVQENNNPDNDDAMQNDLIKRKVSQMSRNPSSPSVASPFGLRAERHSAHSLPSRASASAISPQPTLRNLWHMPRLKRKSSSVENGLATYAFASSITDLCLRHGVRVPLLVTKLVSEIERRGLDEEGLYRQSGSTSQIQRVKERLSKDPEATDLTDTDTFFDLHALCGALKDYFRRISPPIFTSELYEKFIACARLSGENRLHVLKDLLTQLPPEHHTTLQFIMQHLKRLVELSEKNKMSASNVAVCFGPTLVRTDADIDGATLMHNTGPQNKLVQLLVSNYDFLFEAEGHGESGAETEEVAARGEEAGAEDISAAENSSTHASKAPDGSVAPSSSSAQGDTTLEASQESAANVASSPHDYAVHADMLAYLAGSISSLPEQDPHGPSTDEATDDDAEMADDGERSPRRARQRHRQGSYGSDEHGRQRDDNSRHGHDDSGEDTHDAGETNARTTTTAAGAAAASAASEAAQEAAANSKSDSDKKQAGAGSGTRSGASTAGDSRGGGETGSGNGYLEVHGYGKSQQRATSEPARSQRPADEATITDTTGSQQQGEGAHPTTPPRKAVRATGELGIGSSPRLDRPRSVPRRRREGRRSGSLPLETAGSLKTPQELHRRGAAPHGEDEAERRRESSMALNALLSASATDQQAASGNGGCEGAAREGEGDAGAAGRTDVQQQPQTKAVDEAAATHSATDTVAGVSGSSSNSNSNEEARRLEGAASAQGGPVKVEQARHRALEVLSEFDRAFCEFETREDIQALHRAGTPVDDFFLEDEKEDEVVEGVQGGGISKSSDEQQQSAGRKAKKEEGGVEEENGATAEVTAGEGREGADIGSARNESKQRREQHGGAMPQGKRTDDGGGSGKAGSDEPVGANPASRPLKLLVSRPRRPEELSQQRACDGADAGGGADVPKRPSYEAALANPSAETPNVPERQFRVVERPRRRVGPTTSGMAQLRATTSPTQQQQQQQQLQQAPPRGVTLARPPPSYSSVDRAQRLVLRRDGKSFATSNRESTI